MKLKLEDIDRIEEIILIAGELLYILGIFVMLAVIVTAIIAFTGG